MTRRASALCSRMGGLLGLALVLSSIPAWGRDAVSRSAADPGPAWRARLESARVPGGHAGPFRPTAAPSLDGSPVEYLILTNDEMAAEFQKLAAWKTAKGVPAVVRTLAQVEVSSVQGSDLAETIRMYIRAAYLFWGVRFVLLGGDTDVIPGRYAEMELLGLSHPISELYYSCLNGNWNADGDAFFGEAFVSASDPGDDADLLSEVFLGRAPVSDVAEAALFVAKTLEHENPQLTDYQEKLLVLAEVLFPADYDPNGPPPSADGAVFAQEIVALIPEWMQSTLLYEAHELWPDGMPLTVESATSGINSGYGAVVHIGHGYRYTLSVGNGSLDVGSAEGFANGTRAGLFYLLNCTATAFDFESMAEALLLNPNGGATVVVGAAREAFPLAARDYQLAFFEQLYVAGERRVGVAMTRSREELVDGAYLPTVDRWTQLVYTLLGDPELSVWTRARTDLQIAGVPAAFEVGGQALALQVRNTDGPLAGALVCVRKAGEDYRFGRTAAAGRVEFDLQPRSPGDAQLTVTAADHLPVQLTVPVVSQGIGLVVAGTGLQDDGGGSGVGNLDGRLDAGETVTLGVPLRNGGSTPTSGISATLVSNDAAVEVLQGSSAYPDLGPGGLRSALTPFVVRAAPGVVDHSVVTLTLSLDHAGGSDTRRLELLVHAARLRLVGLRLDDARAGNGDGVQDANEEVDLYYTLKNDGSGTAMNVELRLESPGAGMEILSGTVAPGDLLPGSTTEGTTALAVREADVIQSRSARLVLAHLQDPDGEIRNVELRPPAAPSGLRFGVADAGGVVHLEWERNTDADLLGYHVYRALSAQGPFERVNADAALQSYFRDTGLEPSTRYHYRAAAVDSALVEGPPSGPVSVSTNPPQLGGWPLAVNNTTASSPGVADIDADGALDVVAAANQVFAWDAQGIELFDADNNAFTWGVFYGSSEVFGSVSLADLDPQPGREIVVATWDPEDRFVAVVDGGGRTLPGWPQPLAPAGADLRGAHVPPVIANLDEQGAPEILLAARDGRLYGWHADGTEIADGDDDPGTHGVLLDTGSLFLRCAPGVADLDPERPGLEIAVGSTDGTLYVLDASGAPLPGWPRITFGEGTPFGTWFASGISLADLDRDGSLEMVFLESGARLHAMHLDGSELDGFPVPGIKATSLSVVPSPAIADLANSDRNLDEALAASAIVDRGLFVDFLFQRPDPIMEREMQHYY
ncbi:MAG: C25 family cysteine peptidase, partial [Candidatus Krumholzibacteriia bacterium]